MAWRLINHHICPPGEFIYEQTEGVRRKFPGQPDINALARTVAEFRLANGLARATAFLALEDIDFFNCQRLGFCLDWCYNTDKSFALTSAPKHVSGCGGCGARVR